MYSVDYLTLKGLIRPIRRELIFRAVIRDPQHGNEQTVQLFAKDGHFVACSLIEKDGSIIPLPAWEKYLASFGRLEWTMVAAEISPPSSPVPPSSSYSMPLTASSPYPIISQGTRKFSQEQLQELPLLWRRVYSLVDGRRTIEDIARLLSKSPSAIYETALALARLGCIHITEKGNNT